MCTQTQDQAHCILVQINNLVIVMKAEKKRVNDY